MTFGPQRQPAQGCRKQSPAPRYVMMPAARCAPTQAATRSRAHCSRPSGTHVLVPLTSRTHKDDSPGLPWDNEHSKPESLALIITKAVGSRSRARFHFGPGTESPPLSQTPDFRGRCVSRRPQPPCSALKCPLPPLRSLASALLQFGFPSFRGASQSNRRLVRPRLSPNEGARWRGQGRRGREARSSEKFFPRNSSGDASVSERLARDLFCSSEQQEARRAR
ncbi:hypothetical protein SKAU_G00017730 [Synaphobranchus kaupii]|uniref:Uncharacterized protein n=1 Tax=Synaphobranchus kaupii TaxID=118154 RepID=A0A9Q1GCG1_SYNKA|nr:hypothetical protein SKAU_G00017730 [Synaphobranchus kaupii]